MFLNKGALQIGKKYNKKRQNYGANWCCSYWMPTAILNVSKYFKKCPAKEMAA